MNTTKLISFSLLLLVTACSTSLDDVEDNPLENYNLVWETLDQRFSLFEINDVENWDDVYQEFLVRINPAMSDDSLHSVLNDLLWKLKDRHSSISSPFQYQRRFSYDSNFSQEVLDNNYLFSKKTAGPLEYAILEDNIAYVYIPTFGRTITTNHVADMMGDLGNTAGMIIDVRENGGGNELHAKRVASVFCDQKRMYRVSYTKSGPAHDDFEKSAEVYIEPNDQLNYVNPVVLITNKGTYSASTDFAMMMRQFPKVSILGDTIGGGLGTPTFMQMPNGWSFRFSSSYSLDPNGKQFENGLPPDTLVYLDSMAVLNNMDNLVESAKEIILE